MLVENFTTSNGIFTHQAIFSTPYIGKSFGKQDHYNLGGYCTACDVQNFWNLKKCNMNIPWKSPGNWLGWTCRHPVSVLVSAAENQQICVQLMASL